ncbi:MAG: hypothetical protein EOR00_29735 [Mesorhizobium sp.]|uniref:hypothetical protein n=1 Tax=Mesorhizobium sp. TaxID=1871066 RepID=UPI000FE4E96C|nr:hypothetical protein [Mesorhizobium sp.]RWP10975.1 MAG: hypothetical protein EOR00_29735 [Mesorhizobium sp.]
MPIVDWKLGRPLGAQTDILFLETLPLEKPRTHQRIDALVVKSRLLVGQLFEIPILELESDFVFRPAVVEIAFLAHLHENAGIGGFEQPSLRSSSDISLKRCGSLTSSSLRPTDDVLAIFVN